MEIKEKELDQEWWDTQVMFIKNSGWICMPQNSSQKWWNALWLRHVSLISRM
jgi:hypothetical protein